MLVNLFDEKMEDPVQLFENCIGSFSLIFTFFCLKPNILLGRYIFSSSPFKFKNPSPSILYCLTTHLTTLLSLFSS